MLQKVRDYLSVRESELQRLMGLYENQESNREELQAVVAEIGHYRRTPSRSGQKLIRKLKEKRERLLKALEGMPSDAEAISFSMKLDALHANRSMIENMTTLFDKIWSDFNSLPPELQEALRPMVKL